MHPPGRYADDEKRAFWATVHAADFPRARVSGDNRRPCQAASRPPGIRHELQPSSFPPPGARAVIAEQRRRAYLSAMQVGVWLPRVELPFAAPSRLPLLEPGDEPVELGEEAAPAVGVAPSAAAPVTPPTAAPAPSEAPRPRVEMPRPAVAPVETRSETPSAPAVLPPPRFALQLLRAGDCLLLVELPTGEPFQSRDPAYLLLRDMLRAAGLPDSPLQVGDGEPIRWPLLVRGGMDQGPEAARDYVQGVLAGELEQGGRCTWLIGTPALRFAGEVDETAYNREVQVDGLGVLWALPGLELLIDEPARKGELWKAMRRLMPRWLSQPE